MGIYLLYNIFVIHYIQHLYFLYRYVLDTISNTKIYLTILVKSLQKIQNESDNIYSIHSLRSKLSLLFTFGRFAVFAGLWGPEPENHEHCITGVHNVHSDDINFNPTQAQMRL